MEVKCVRNLRLGQKHKVVVPKLHVPNSLGEAEAMAVPDFVISEVYPWGVERSELVHQCCRVEMVTVMVERAGEADRRYAGLAPPSNLRDSKTSKIAPYPLL